jgi:iron complex transport system ATP-binding protein
MDYYFKLEKLTVGYDGKPIVSEIEAGVHKGQILTLIGANGSGKSTVLKSIAKQLKPVGGSVRVGGHSLEALSPKEYSRKAAVLLTERPRPELMTCEDVASAGRYPYTGMLGILSDKDHEKVREALAVVNALEIKDKSFSQVSDGQKQRVLLAGAIAQEPELLILDEPTSFLDIRYAVEILDSLRKMADEKGLTAVMSLHELSYAKRISDLVMCVKDGKVLYLDTPANIFNEGVISRLFDLPQGYYAQLFGGL